MSESLNTAIEQIGGPLKTAAKLKVSHQVVYMWIKRGWLPLARAVKMEKLTGVSRSKLIDPKIAKLLNI